MLFSSLLFLLPVMLILLWEIGRKPSLMSLFVFVFGVQILLPGFLIPIILSGFNDRALLGNFFFDRIYVDLTPRTVALSAAFCIFFVLSLYSSYFGCRGLFRRISYQKVAVLEASTNRCLLFLLAGFGSASFLIFSMPGENLLARYASLVAFRAQHPDVAEIRTFITANLFSLTSSFSILSVLLLFLVKDRARHLKLLMLVLSVLAMIFLGWFTASRRTLLIQATLVYLTYVLISGRWNLLVAILMGIVFIPLIALGKEILAQLPLLSAGISPKFQFDTTNTAILLLNALSSIGISINSSWATLQYMSDTELRFGVDHLLSILRFLPMSSLGVDESLLFPERIVRISTTVFAGKGRADIPPGLIGQMWLDFRVLGPVLWGCSFGAIIAYLQIKMENTRKSWVSCGVYTILVFIVALPVNSGSFDFTFSVDVFFLLLMLFLVTKSTKVQSGSFGQTSRRCTHG